MNRGVLAEIGSPRTMAGHYGLDMKPFGEESPLSCTGGASAHRGRDHHCERATSIAQQHICERREKRLDTIRSNHVSCQAVYAL